jgi:hypothetical protein
MSQRGSHYSRGIKKNRITSSYLLISENVICFGTLARTTQGFWQKIKTTSTAVLVCYVFLKLTFM